MDGAERPRCAWRIKRSHMHTHPPHNPYQHHCCRPQGALTLLRSSPGSEAQYSDKGEGGGGGGCRLHPLPRTSEQRRHPPKENEAMLGQVRPGRLRNSEPSHTAESGACGSDVCHNLSCLHIRLRQREWSRCSSKRFWPNLGRTLFRTAGPCVSPSSSRPSFELL